jgi:SAM-dependent methyltransferase
MTNLDTWADALRSPLDHQPVQQTDAGDWQSADGAFISRAVTIGGRTMPDFRAQDTPQTVTVAFRIPVTPLDRGQVARDYFCAIHADFPHYSRAEIRQRYGTKLDKGMQFYCQQLWRERGADARILDLGCGSGGNGRYLQSLGFTHILSVDWEAAGADMLVDAHRLPLADGVFDLVISTAVFEHLYNPFIAMGEIARVCHPGGWFVGSASFWEGWHAASHFHMTPDGWHTILDHAGMEIVDLWQGWGILPSALSHVLTPGRLRGLGYVLQSGVENIYRLALGEQGVRRLHLRASGSYQVCARKGG